MAFQGGIRSRLRAFTGSDRIKCHDSCDSQPEHYASAVAACCSKGTTTLLILEGGLTSSITTNCWSTSKETEELLATLAESPTLATSFLACLRGEGVQSLDGLAGAFFSFFLSLHLYSKSSSSSCCSGCF